MVVNPSLIPRHCVGDGGRPRHPRSCLIPLYMTGLLDVKRYALVMGQRAGPGTEADSDDEILGEALLRDEVDDLVTAWRAQRPDLDVEPMQVLSRISRLARHLDIARREAFAEHGLESWGFDVLSALRRQGPPCQLTPGALVILTDKGQARVDAALAGLLRRERALLGGLDGSERQHLADLLRILLAPFDAVLAPLAAGPPLKAPPSLVAPSSLLSPGGAGGPLAR